MCVMYNDMQALSGQGLLFYDVRLLEQRLSGFLVLYLHIINYGREGLKNQRGPGHKIQHSFFWGRGESH